jgi:hypothetical protein
MGDIMKTRALPLPHILKPAAIFAAIALMTFIAPHAQAAAATGDIQFFPPSNLASGGCNSTTALMFDGKNPTYCATPSGSNGNSGQGTVTIMDAYGHHYIAPSYITSSLLDTSTGALSYRAKSVSSMAGQLYSITAQNPTSCSPDPATGGCLNSKDSSTFQIGLDYATVLTNVLYSITVPASQFNSTAPANLNVVLDPTNITGMAQSDCYSQQSPGVFVSASTNHPGPNISCLDKKMTITPSVWLQKLD